MMPMKVWLYTLCWNEEDIIPFVVEYWKHLNVDKAIVYDNGSTDKSLELLSKIPFVEIMHFETDGMNDNTHIEIKNSCWKECKENDVDYVIVCDMDEVLWSDDFEGELKKMKDGHFNVLGCEWHSLCEDYMPKHEDGVLLHTQCHKFYHQNINKTHVKLGKFTLFDPHLVDEIGYAPGAHVANVTPNLDLYISDHVTGMHIDKGFGADYMIARRHLMNDRLSQINRQLRYCYEYGYSDEVIREEYKRNQSSSYDINAR